MLGIFYSSRVTVGLGGNISRLRQRPLCQHGADHLIYKHAEQNDEADGAGNSRASQHLVVCDRADHTQSNTRLRQKGDTEVVNYMLVTARKL